MRYIYLALLGIVVSVVIGYFFVVKNVEPKVERRPSTFILEVTCPMGIHSPVKDTVVIHSFYTPYINYERDYLRIQNREDAWYNAKQYPTNCVVKDLGDVYEKNRK